MGPAYILETHIRAKLTTVWRRLEFYTRVESALYRANFTSIRKRAEQALFIVYTLRSPPARISEVKGLLFPKTYESSLLSTKDIYIGCSVHTRRLSSKQVLRINLLFLEDLTKYCLFRLPEMVLYVWRMFRRFFIDDFPKVFCV